MEVWLLEVSHSAFRVGESMTDVLCFYFVIGGPKGALGSAVACGILLGVFEGVGVLFSRFFAEGMKPQLPPCESLLSQFPSAIFDSLNSLSTGSFITSKLINSYVRIKDSFDVPYSVLILLLFVHLYSLNPSFLMLTLYFGFVFLNENAEQGLTLEKDII